MTTRQIIVQILLVVVVVFGLFVTGCGLLFQEWELSERDHLNTEIPLTNTAIYRAYVETSEALYSMATGTARVQLTAAAAATPTPNLATHQIPLTQTAVQADYEGTMAALDDMATGTAGALFAATPEATAQPGN